MFYYGYLNDQLLVEMIKVVTGIMDNDYETRQRATRMLIETAAHETLFGTYPDTTEDSGMGLFQFDRIAFDDIMINSREHFEFIKEKFGIDLTLVRYEDLRYNPFLSTIFARLKYKRVPKGIPSNTEERYKYYKKYYNSSEGKATYHDFMTHARDTYRRLRQQGIEYA